MSDAEPTVDRVLEAFERRFRTAAPFVEDRARAEELALEARPAVDALLAAAQGAQLDSREHREGLAMVTLLGRRAGELEVTPTAALALVPALLEALREAGGSELADARDPSDAQLAMLQGLCMEGYVASRDERQAEQAARQAAESQPIVRVAPRCVALLLSGVHPPELLAEVVDRLGRELLAADAAACVVDVSHLREPSPERAAEVFAADATARMLGVSCVFAVPDERWLEAARLGPTEVELLAREPAFDRALARALEACGLSLRRTGRWRQLLGRERG